MSSLQLYKSLPGNLEELVDLERSDLGMTGLVIPGLVIPGLVMLKDKDKDRRAGWKCPSWNYSETHGKCRFEIENAPEKCNRAQECSYCKAKQLTPVDHQRHFCRKRLAEEEG
jgi:hypothetical protein